MKINKKRLLASLGKHHSAAPERFKWLAVPALVAAAILAAIPASAEVTGIRISKDETVSVGDSKIRHVAGKVSGKAERNEPDVPTLEKVVGLKYEADFELWLPVSEGNGRFWFSVLNRGNDIGGLRDGILRRGGGYGWCAWQAKNVALEQWAADGKKPPDSRMFVLEKRESPRAKHLPSEPAELPATDDLGIAKGGVRLPPVEVPVVRYVSDDGKAPKAVPLDKAELARRYGTPEDYRKKVSEAADRLIRDRLLPESARSKYAADAAKVAW